MRGGEKVLLSLLRLFPDAPIFTLLHVPGSVAPEIEARPIHTTFVQRLPDAARRYRSYLPLFPAAAATIDLSGFDLAVSCSHCVVKGVRVPAGLLHLCYCLTPMRYVWDRYDDYFGKGRASWPVRWAMHFVAPRLRAWDVATAARPFRYAADSAFVASRIERYYSREAEVILPPIDTDFFTPGPDADGEFDLVVSALAPYKWVDVILDAYRGTGRCLRIVGTGPEEARLRSVAPPEAIFEGRVSDTRLRDLYRRCRVVIMAGVEDFGIVPLEAMACGRPAIAFAEGGGRETVVPGRTGFLFQEPTAESLRQALHCLETTPFDRMQLRAHAEAHGRALFERRFREFVEGALREAGQGQRGFRSGTADQPC